MLFKWDRNIKPPSHQASPNKWPTDSPQKRRASSVPQLVKYEERAPNHCPKAVATDIQWIGLRENLQETIDFPMKYGVFL